MRSLSSQFNFSEKKDFKHLLKWFLLFIAIYSVLGVFQHRAELGLFPDEVKNHVLGNSNEFTPALNLGELAEILHIRLFLINLILLILFSSFNRFANQANKAIPMMALAYGLCLLEVLSLLGLRWISPIFTYTYILAFLTLQLFILSLSLFLIKKIDHA